MGRLMFALLHIVSIMSSNSSSSSRVVIEAAEEEEEEEKDDPGEVVVRIKPFWPCFGGCFIIINDPVICCLNRTDVRIGKTEYA